MVRKDRKYVWVENFSFADNILIIGNRFTEFKNYIREFKLLLSKVGLSVHYNKTKIFYGIKSKINFYFLGFEFIIMFRTMLRKTNLFSKLDKINKVKSGQKGFVIILKPKSDKISEIKKKLKLAISGIHRVSKVHICKTFRWINSLLLGWGQYFYFNQGCVYGKMLDNFVFINLRKALVKKFRYKGLLRPKWVAYNFIGLSKNNPNKKAWQFQSLKYITKHRKQSYEYIWYLSDTFSRLCITSFLINRKIRSLSFYENPSIFQNIMSKNIAKRLLSKF